MTILGFRSGVGGIFARRRTVFLSCFLFGLLASGWVSKPIVREYATYVYLTPNYNSWVEHDGMRSPVSNCGLLVLKLDEDGRLMLNNDPNGTIDDLTELRERLEWIIKERRQQVVIVDLGPGSEKKFGNRIVNAEFVVRPEASSKYGDFIRLVDLAASLAPAVVYVETPSYSRETETEFQRWVIQDRMRVRK